MTSLLGKYKSAICDLAVTLIRILVLCNLHVHVVLQEETEP